MKKKFFNNILNLAFLIITIGVCGCTSQVITRSPNSNSLKILNNNWQLSKLNNSQVNFINEQGTALFILSAQHNKITGFSGCNNFSGKYELQQNDKRLSFAHIISTRMICAKDAGAENDFFNVLAQSQYYHFKNEKLILLNGKKIQLATFIVTE